VGVDDVLSRKDFTRHKARTRYVALVFTRVGTTVTLRGSFRQAIPTIAVQLLTLSAIPAPLVAQLPADSSTVAATVQRYHRALVESDSATVLELLVQDAVILESGSMESMAEYRSHHLPADIAFARAVKGKRSPIRVTMRGDVAWAASTTTTRGRFRGKAVNSIGAELMVLTRTADGWKISAIHWSSRNRRS
jgi:ketosteroid isomerase-like protein